MTEGSKYKELAHYKINEKIGYGPECFGILTKQGVLMIVTQDLNYRGSNKAGKTVIFSDNEGDRESGSSSALPKKIMNQLPSRERDNVHRCAVELIIALCQYSDVKKNFGNTGFKITKETKTDQEGESAYITKEKPFIIDFQLTRIDQLFQQYDSFEDKTSEFQKRIGAEVAKEFEKALEYQTSELARTFVFNQSPKIYQEALKKIFLDENGDIKKFQNAIEESYRYASSFAMTDPYEKDRDNHLKSLQVRKKYVLDFADEFLKNQKIRDFLTSEGQKIKSAKTRGGAPTASSSSPSAQAIIDPSEKSRA